MPVIVSPTFSPPNWFELMISLPVLAAPASRMNVLRPVAGEYGVLE